MLLEPYSETFGLHSCLIIPIGAKNRQSIEKYIGTIDKVIGNGKALIVNFVPLSQPNELPVWKHSRSNLIIEAKQIWIHVNCNNYRKIYLSEFVNTSKSDVIDHLMNRRLARSLGYNYIRLLHVSRNVNSSSGRGGESLAVENLEIGIRINPDINSSEVVYADPMDLLKMLDIKVGGFGLDAVRDNHYLFYL